MPTPYELTNSYTIVGPTYVSVKNAFFREANAQHLTEVIAPELIVEFGLAESGEPLRIAEVGCSTGKETWSMAASLALGGHNFHIEAFDVNPHVLAEAREPYPYTLAMLRGKLERLGISLGHLSFFEAVDATHIRATETLRDHVSFKELDVCEESLDPRRFHAVIINNVMTHYFNWKRIRALMTTNLALGLLPNGVITSNDFEPFPRRAARVAGLVEAYDLGGPSRGDAMWWRYQPRPAKPTIREWFTGVRP